MLTLNKITLLLLILTDLALIPVCCLQLRLSGMILRWRTPLPWSTSRLFEPSSLYGVEWIRWRQQDDLKILLQILRKTINISRGAITFWKCSEPKTTFIWTFCFCEFWTLVKLTKGAGDTLQSNSFISIQCNKF